MIRTLIALLRDDTGATMVEYALMIALISLASIVALMTLQTQISQLLANVGAQLTASSSVR